MISGADEIELRRKCMRAQLLMAAGLLAGGCKGQEAPETASAPPGGSAPGAAPPAATTTAPEKPAAAASKTAGSAPLIADLPKGRQRRLVELVGVIP